MAGVQTLTLDTANNTFNSILATNRAPDGGTLTLQLHAPRTRSNDYTCLSVLRLGVIVPEPAGALLLIVTVVALRRHPAAAC